MKKILILGGTGAMGVPLVEQLSNIGYEVVVTSRRKRNSDKSNVRYVIGNAHDDFFLNPLLEVDDWDAIVDFMVYTTQEFKGRVDMLLDNTKQYIFVSSARVYAKSDAKINENTPRLLDVIEDEDYLNTDEYSLTKARQEDILKNSEKKNWTIIRPSITYNNNRLQLGVLEKEHWLYRALHGRSIVFSRDIGCKLTAMTTGDDVIKGIISIIGKQDAQGEAFHITEENSYKWNEILNIYLDILEKILEKRPNVIVTEKTTCFEADWNIYQIIYCRYYNRSFDNSKIGKYIDTKEFVDAKTGLQVCLESFLKNPQFGNINWKLEAINDRVSGEWTSLSEIPTRKMKMIYLMYRLRMEVFLKMYQKIKLFLIK